MVSGPLTTVITGSEVYPWGTTEQYPNTDANEGHFYMECSNKGICDRKSGTCDCFDGYEGTACVRASCPNDCSGHGTCESIKELAEMKSYDTNAHDTTTTAAVGAQDFSSAVEESYAYDLWDEDKTLGCKCDPVYYGADCSLKKCKYGVDPLFYDNADGVIKQTTVIHLGSKSTGKGDITGTGGGSYRVVFYDVFGEKYVTKQIGMEADAAGLKEALEALPNGVISASSTDITGTPPAAVTVTQQANAGTVTKIGTIGQGTEGSSGAGLGTQGTNGAAYGNEFTVTFSSNPGILKSIELDTREINNPGSPEYWVANVRQGQFSSRYSTNLGRVNTLIYGSKLLYTNSDWSSDAAANTLVKIGGQEARVTAADAHHLTLSEPFLGASIIPVLTDTGIVASALSRQVAACALCDTNYGSGNGGAVSAADAALTIAIPGTTIIANHLKSGAKLYSGQCPFTSKIADGSLSITTTSVPIEDHDCASDVVTAGSILYRRSDSPSNQNLYKTSSDTGLATQTLRLARGSSDVYTVGAAADSDTDISTSLGADPVPASAPRRSLFAIRSFPAAGSVNFINGHGPFTTASNDGVITAGHHLAGDTFSSSAGTEGTDFAGDATSAMPLHTAVAADASLAAGKILMLAS